MKKSIRVGLTVIVAALLIALILSVSVSSMDAFSAPDYSDYANTNVFAITSQEDFASFVKLYNNNSSYPFTNKTIVLYSDVDLQANPLYIPSFRGNFVGNGHVIYNLSTAIFGSVERNARVEDLVIITTSAKGNVLAATNSGTVEEVTLSGTVSASRSAVNVSLVGNNVGTIKKCVSNATYCGVDGAGAIGMAGIAYTNSGIIENCAFTGDFLLHYERNVTYTVGGIAYFNTPTGSISGSTAAFNVNFESNGENTFLPTVYAIAGFQETQLADGAVRAVNVKNSAAYVGFSGYDVGGAPVSIAFADGDVKNSFAVFPSGDAVYSVDGAITEGDATDLNALFTDGFVRKDDGYPMPDTMFDGDGEGEPFAISALSDLFKMRASGISGEFSYLLNADIVVKSLSEIPILRGFSGRGGTLDGRNFALIGAGERIFDVGYGLTSENLGFVTNVSATLSGTAGGYYNGDTDFGSEEAQAYIEGLRPSGSGTYADPYVVTNARELKGLGGLKGLAVVMNDIVLNSAGDGVKNTLNLDEIGVILCGNGHSVIGLIDEPLATSLSVGAEIRDLVLRGSGASVATTNSGKVTNVTVSFGDGRVTDDNRGTLNAVKFYGSSDGAVFATENAGNISGCINYGAFVGAAFAMNNSANISGSINYGNGSGYAFAGENTGKISKCVNFGAADYAFRSDVGSTENCINYGAVATSVGTGVTATIDFHNNTVYDKGEAHEVESFDHVVLSKYASLDFDKVYGYRIGSNRPELRGSGVRYKTHFDTPFSAFSPDSERYSEDMTYTKATAEAMIADPDILEYVVFTWLYNGEEYDGAVHNAGTYTVSAVFYGNDEYLSASFVTTFTISKANKPADIVISDFAPVTRTYDGEDYVPSTPDPDNKAALDGYGYTLSWRVYDGQNVVYGYGVVNAGTYTQEITATSVNYEDVTLNRTITIDKAELKLSVGEMEVDYLALPDFSEVFVTIVSGRVSRDSHMGVSQIVHDYLRCFGTNYKVGDGVGTYSVSFSGNADNYKVSATDGTLTVRPIALPDTGISFYGATTSLQGSRSEIYNGSPIVLSATYPTGVTVEYENNSNTAANSDGYVVRAKFSKVNYITLILEVILIIEKAPLIVTAPSVNATYGDTVSLDNLTPTCAGLVVGEEELIDGLFTLTLYSHGVESEGGLLNRGEYEVRASALHELDNYYFSFVSGAYIVSGAPLTALYDNNDNENTDFADVNTVYEVGMRISPKLTYFGENVAIAYVYYEGSTRLDTDFVTDAGTYRVVATVTPLGDLAINYDETEFTCTVFIDKKSTSIAFDKDSYNFTYDSTNHASAGNFPYTSDVPESSAIKFRCTLNGQNSAALHAGSYVLTLTYDGAKNYHPSVATATLTVEPKTVEITYTETYDYNGSTVRPTVASIVGAYGDELREEHFRFFNYRNVVSGSVLSGAPQNAGRYSCSVELTNADYVPSNATVTFRILPIAVDLNWGTLSYTYGVTGAYRYNNRTYYINGEQVTCSGMQLGNMQFDVTVNLPSRDVGTYYLNNDMFVTSEWSNYSFNLTSGTHTVVIAKRELQVGWMYDRKSVSDPSKFETPYIGRSITANFHAAIVNFAYGEGVDDFNITTAVTGKSTDIYHAGEYTINLSIEGAPNYYLSSSFMRVRVTPVTLTFTISDAEIYVGMIFSGPTYTVRGMVGQDIGKEATRLDGAVISTVTDYTTSSPAGKYNVSIDARFTDYVAEIGNTARLTVRANPYPSYTLGSVTYVYNGDYQTVTIANVHPDLRVEYENNSRRDVGTQTVVARIWYPIGVMTEVRGVLTIIKGTPTADVGLHEAVYKDNIVLTDDFIEGRGLFNGQEIPGKFEFVSDRTLRLGQHTYSYLFTPDDAANLNAYQGTFTIHSEIIDIMVFAFTPLEKFVMDAEGNATITGNVTISLRNVLNGLTLHRNGYRVDFILLTETERLNVDVCFKGEKVLGFPLNVTYYDLNSSHGVMIDASSFDLTGMRFSGDTLYVTEGGGRLALAENLKNDYTLLVNGYVVTEYLLNGNEGSVTIVVRNTGNRSTVYSAVFEVKIDPVVSQDTGNSNTLYYVIGGVAGGVIVVLAVGLIIWRKIHG